MLLITGRAAGASAGGGITVVAVAILSVFGGGENGENGNGAQPDDVVANERDANEPPGDTGNDGTGNDGTGTGNGVEYDPAGHDSSLNGDDVAEPNGEAGTGHDDGNGAQTDPLLAPKFDFADLLRAVKALESIQDRPLTVRERAAVFTGRLTRVEQFQQRQWRILRNQLQWFVDNDRTPHEGSNSTRHLGSLPLARQDTEHGQEWRIVVR